MEKFLKAGAFSPSEVELMQSCFDEILARRGIDKGSEKAVPLASAIVRAFSRGVSDRDELIRLFDRP
jgi:hypothetical protein